MATTLLLCDTPDFQTIQAVEGKNEEHPKISAIFFYENLFYKTGPVTSTTAPLNAICVTMVAKMKKCYKRDPTQNCLSFKMST